MKSPFTQPIFVTGVERSGATIVARSLALAGAWSGDCTDMMENRELKRLMDLFYQFNGWDPKGQYPLPNYYPTPAGHPDWETRVREILVHSGYDFRSKWMYKANRLNQVWNLWNLFFPEARWVIVRRRPTDIIQSCVKTGFMTAMKDQGILHQIQQPTERDGWLWWIHEQEQNFQRMIQSGVQYREIWPERMAQGDFSQVLDLLDWVELNWTPDILTVVEPLIKYNKNLKTNGSTSNSF